MRGIVWLTVLVLLCAGAVGSSAAGKEPEPLLESLVENGVITREQAIAVPGEVAVAHVGETKTTLGYRRVVCLEDPLSNVERSTDQLFRLDSPQEAHAVGRSRGRVDAHVLVEEAPKLAAPRLDGRPDAADDGPVSF